MIKKPHINHQNQWTDKQFLSLKNRILRYYSYLIIIGCNVIRSSYQIGCFIQYIFDYFILVLYVINDHTLKCWDMTSYMIVLDTYIPSETTPQPTHKKEIKAHLVDYEIIIDNEQQQETLNISISCSFNFNFIKIYKWNKLYAVYLIQFLMFNMNRLHGFKNHRSETNAKKSCYANSKDAC